MIASSATFQAAVEDAVHSVDGNFRDRVEEGYKKQVIKRVKDRLWRLNNLYWIVNEHSERVKFRCRPAQLDFIQNIWYRNLVLKARQLGFTTLIDLFGLDLILFNSNVNGGIITHRLEDSGVIYRDKIKFPYLALPATLLDDLPYTKLDAGELRLANNSGIRVGTSMRSGTMQFLHISEHGKICARYPEKAREIKTGSIPAVHQGSYLFIESTAEGKSGDFFDLADSSRRRAEAGKPLTPLSIKFHFYPWWKNDSYRLDPAGVVIPQRLEDYFAALEPKIGVTLDAAQRAWYSETENGDMGLGDDMKREHPSTPDEAFEQVVEGAYYKRQIDKAYAEGRISEVLVDPTLPVHTMWDIGHGDATAIWFFQVVGEYVCLVDYHEQSGEGLPYYVSVLERKRTERGFKVYGRFIGPHDLNHHGWGTGKTKAELAFENHGIVFEVAPEVSLSDGIEATRYFFARCIFDQKHCAEGISRLSNYRKDWDAKAGVWKSKPRHDENSHGADSFRYGALATPGILERINQALNPQNSRTEQAKDGVL